MGMMKHYQLKIPIRIVSEANLPEHWTKKHKRHKSYKDAITAIWRTSNIPKIEPPCEITLTRVAPRSLDADNLVTSMKNPTDIVASLIIPGLAPGRADDGHGLTFNYCQKKGATKEYALLIDIET